MAIQRFASASHSNIGKSTTQSGCQPSSTQAEVAAELEPERAERVVHDLRLVGAEENQVAGFRSGALEDARDRCIGQELEDRRLQALAPLRPASFTFI